MPLKEGRDPFNAYLGLDALRNQGFDEISAIGEVIDNSIDAKASSIHILFDWKEKEGKAHMRSSKFIFIDDGEGMDSKILFDCLVVGESVSKYNPRGIGRYGVGGTFAGISQARRIEVYSKKIRGEWKFTFLDLDELRDGKGIPDPIKRKPPEEVKKYLQDHGTVVIWDKTDRSDFHEGDVSKLSDWIARTYRKFIGLEIIENEKPIKNKSLVKIYVDDNLVAAYDPLYVTKNTKFPNDERAKMWEYKIHLKEITGKPRTGEILIRFSYLPTNWWKKDQSGGTDFAKDRRIPNNEGFSIIRENREVHYGDIPYFKVDGARPKEDKIMYLDRWWGCEILFTKEADDLFGIQNNKSRVTLSDDLHMCLENRISPSITSFREKIRKIRKQYERESLTADLGHKRAEDMVENSGVIQKGTLKSSQLEKLKKYAQVYARTKAEQAEIIKRLKTRSFVPLEDDNLDPTGPFISFEYDFGNLVLKYNMNHPFIKKLYSFLNPSNNVRDKKKNVNKNSASSEDTLQMIKAYIDVMLAAFGESRSRFPDLNAKEEIQETINTLLLYWGDIASKISKKS